MLNIDLSNQVAWVTGVTSGIGQGVAKVLSQAGCHVVGCGRSPIDSSGAQQFLKSVKEQGVEAYYYSVDTTSLESINQFVEEAIQEVGKIDIVISNAGANVFEGSEDCTPEQWQHNMDLNLRSHWWLSKKALPYLRESSNGVIVVMTSNHANSTIPGCFPYNVSKTALKGLVQSMAIEWGPHVRTVGVAPGFIDTPGNDTWFQSFDNPAQERKRTEEMHPVKKLGTVEEVGYLCAFLASPMAQFISGTTYLMDGGRSALMQD